MSEKRASLEIIAPTVDEAVAKGLTDLGLSEEAVEIEVLDEGNRGIFGLGSRQARIRLTIKSGSRAKQARSDHITTEPQAQSAETKPASPIESTVTSNEEEDYVLTIARDTVIELLEKMKVKAEVTAEYGQVDDARNRIPIHVNVNGNDLSILIGRRAETLNALQYITALIVSKEIGRSIPLIVDVQGYRARRESQLRQLARRMAEQAIKTGRRQVLEPMPANERRIIHIELRDNSQVTTESIDEEPRRKVTIIPIS